MPIHQQIIYSFPISNQYYSHMNNEPTASGGRVHTTISPPTHFINSCPSPTFYQSTDLGSLLMHGLLHCTPWSRSSYQFWGPRAKEGRAWGTRWISGPEGGRGIQGEGGISLSLLILFCFRFKKVIRNSVQGAKSEKGILGQS